jgi:hypothetical protein
LKQPLDPQSVANVLEIAGVPPLQSKAGELTAFVEDFHLTSFAPVITPFLTDDRAEIRRNAIWALGWIGATPVAGKIADRVEQDPIASCALGVLGATRYSDLIQKNLRHADPDFRRAALAGLMELGAPIAGEEVLVLFKDEDALTRGLAALTWTVVGGAERARQISPLLKDPDASVRGNAVWALYFLGAREFFEDVRLLLRDPAEPVRGAASVFVSKYSETLSDAAKDGLSLEIQEAAPKIGIEKWIASVNLGNAPPRNLRRFLIDMAKPEHSAWRKHGICLLDALSRTLEPAAYRKLTKRGELPHAIDSMEDARRYFRSLGLELETLGQAAMGGRMNAGVVTDGLSLITNRFKVGSTGFVLHQDRIVVMPWEEAMRDWIRKIDRE